MGSVLSQLREGDEYIIVDPGSSDGSREYIQSISHPQIRTVFERDSGPADGLNKGFRDASGDIFCYLNSDDVLLPSALEKVRLSFSANHFDVLIGDGYIIDEESEFVRWVCSDRGITPYRYLIGASVALQQATFFTSEAFRRVGGFNSDNRTCWDGELLLNLLLADLRITYENAELGAFRIYDDSLTGSQRHREAYACDKDRMFLDTFGRGKRFHDKIALNICRISSFASRQIYKKRRFGLKSTRPDSRLWKSKFQ